MTSMRQLFLIIGITLISVLLKAENYPTKFLGIPIDGTKQEMINRLEEKGFIYNEEQDWLSGEFNGKEVIIYISTKNRKVYGISVRYRYFYTAEEIKSIYNDLLQQFQKNPKYIPVNLHQSAIPTEEDIAREMSQNNKEYIAGFLQRTNEADSTVTLNDSFKECTNKYIDKLISLMPSDTLYNETEYTKIVENIGEMCWYEELKAMYINNIVGFQIDKAYGENYILLLIYTNGHNKNIGYEDEL